MNSPLISAWSDRIKHAAAEKRPLQLQGSGSKAFYGHPTAGEVFHLHENTGILSYEPSELVITVNGGTRLHDIEQALAEHHQYLPFEPPYFADTATIAGCVAAGLAGPRRAYAGAVQDFVLGAHLIDGRGDYLRFGGQVMKNVAGYDVSRLLCGSLGTLGVITQLSIKVLPIPAKQVTLRLDLAQDQALTLINQLSAQPLPISASAWHDHQLYIRLAGANNAITEGIKTIGGERLAPELADDFWKQLREQQHAFFQNAPSTHTLWRLSVPSTSPAFLQDLPQLIEWGGALRWLWSDLPASQLREETAKQGGTATAFRHPHDQQIFHPLPAPVLRLQKNLKQKFDPAGIFNPGRLYPGEL